MSSDQQNPSRQRHPKTMAAGARVLALFGMLLCLWVSAFDFQQGTEMKLQDFKTQGRSDDGAAWRLSGSRAVIRGAVYHLEDVRVILHTADEKEFIIESPTCVYRQDTGVIESDDRVHVVGNGLILDGVGYDILIDERRLRIRQSVRMVVEGVGSRATDILPAVDSDEDGGSQADPGAPSGD